MSVKSPYRKLRDDQANKRRKLTRENQDRPSLGRFGFARPTEESAFAYPTLRQKRAKG